MLNLPKNIYIISVVLALCFATTSLMVLISGILGADIAPSPGLATLPMAMMIVGTALSTIPAGMIMKRLGRKRGYIISISVAILGGLIGFVAAKNASFPLFLIAALCFGFNLAFMHQGRFIVIENATSEDQQADGLTLSLLAALFSAIAGPQLGSWGKDLVDSPYGYAGSFLLLVGLLCCALFVLCFYRNLPATIISTKLEGRPIGQIIKQPVFILATGSAAAAYALMSLLMTATPINMHHIDGFSIDQAKLVIQSHIIAMFLPSFITGALLKKGMRISLIIAGFTLYIVVSIIALEGSDFIHYWWALSLLGLGWNLNFLASTTLITNAYHESEKFKAQSTNDFIVFSFQSLAALSAGWLIFNLGWSGLVQISLSLSALWLIIIALLYYKGIRQRVTQSSTW